MVGRRWPHRVFGCIASPAEAKSLAARIVRDFGRDPLCWLEEGRFHIKDDALGGGLQALCIPISDDRFRFVIHSEHTPAARIFLVCHEVAHTFFYVRVEGERPKRAFGGSNSEERFCDTFAFTVTRRKTLPHGLPALAT